MATADTVVIEDMAQDLIWDGVIYRRGTNVVMPRRVALESGRMPADKPEPESKVDSIEDKPKQAPKGRGPKVAAKK